MENLIGLFKRNNIEYEILSGKEVLYHLKAKYEDNIMIEIKEINSEECEYIHNDADNGTAFNVDIIDITCSDWGGAYECHSIKELLNIINSVLSIE